MKKFLTLMIVVSFFTLLFTNGCSTTEEVPPFDVTGAWQFSITVTGIPIALAQNLTFSGSLTSGTVTGWVDPFWGGTGTGTYTTSGNSVTASIIYDDSTGWQQRWNFTGGSGGTNYMSGTGTWYDEFSTNTINTTWTANRL